MYRLALLLPLVALLATTSSAQRRSGGECFYASQVTGFTDAGKDRVLVNINRRAMWELTLSPGCSNPDWALTIGIVSRGSQRICSGRDAELLVPRASGNSVQRCLVRTIRKLSPDEAAAALGIKPDRPAAR